jgi:pimeloyl-ACP methyl ester carboxylesterase
MHSIAQQEKIAMPRFPWSMFFLAALACSPTKQTHSQSLVPDSAAKIPNAIGGGGSAFRFTSRSLGESRSVLIGLPKSFGTTRREYPVIIVLDGEGDFRPAMTVTSELASLGHIPESIVVGIPNTDRLRDLTPPGLSVSGSSKSEGGDRFLDFLEKELMPALKTQFRAGGPIVLVGHSSGGIIATYAGATRPAFRFILSLDGPTHLGDNWLADRLTEGARHATGNLRYVSIESVFGWNDSLWTTLTSAAPKSWRLYRQKLDHESHVSMPFLGIYLGLRTLFQDYAIRSAPQSPTASTLAWYHHLDTLYGAPVYPPSGLLRQVMEDLEMEGQSKGARDAWNLLVTGYGTPSDSTEWRARLAKLAKMPPLTETIEGLLATPAPKTSAASGFVGEWSGIEWMNPDDKHRMVLRIRDSAGVLVGESVSWPEANKEMVMPLTYLKAVSGGLSWGYMNGMRPRGMLVWDGRLDKGTLTGEMRFGGIRFVPPPGMPDHPRIRFELKKVSSP